MMRLVCAVVILAIHCSGTLAAFMRGYLPLNAQELSRRFPLRKSGGRFVAREPSDPPRRVGSANVRHIADGVLRFEGRGGRGVTWLFETSAGMEGDLYTGDLDSNGYQDIVYAKWTGGNGLAPTRHLVILLFDSKGLPVPWIVDGYFETEAGGIADVLDLNRDGHAEVVRQTYDDGYWITSLYEARDARWHLVRTEHAGRKYPHFTRFTHRSNRIPVTPAPGRNPREDDLSNTLSADPTFLTQLQWADVRISERPPFQFSDGRRCNAAAWYSTMTTVLDEPHQRVAASLGAPTRSRQLLEQITKRHVQVSIAGRRYRKEEDGDCAIETIWATSTK